MFDSSKRKNEDKAKGLPQRYKVVGVALLIMFAVVMIGVAWRVLSAGSSMDRPTGRIIYTQSDSRGKRPVVVDLQTGSRNVRSGIPMPYVIPSMISSTSEPASISPDGKWHIRWLETPLESQTFYLEISNQETEPALIGPFYGYPAYRWSPDSQGLFFLAMAEPNTNARYDPLKGEIWRVDMPSQQLIRLTNNSDHEHTVYVSPDGTKLAYIMSRGKESRLHVMDLATGQITTPLPDTSVLFFSWSPDSQWIAFESNQTNGLSDLWIMGVDGRDLQGIAIEPDVWEQSPSWIP